jgi:hypothetical protein
MATILTNVGRTKLLAATPMAPVTLSHIAWGNGNGSIPSVVATRTSLVNEVLRVDCSFPVRDTADPTVIMVSGNIPRTFGGATIREVGVFDNTGALIAYGSVNNEVLPAPVTEYGYTYTGTFRFKLDNTDMVSVINSDAPSFDHRGLTFRAEPNAHPASSIDTTGGRTVQQMFSLSKVVGSSGTLLVGENNIISANTTQTLPSTSGLAVGSRVVVSKYSTVVATVQVNNTGTEQIRFGANSSDYEDFDAMLIDDVNIVEFVWTGVVWECKL